MPGIFYFGLALLLATGLCWCMTGILVSAASRRGLDMRHLMMLNGAFGVFFSLLLLALCAAVGGIPALTDYDLVITAASYLVCGALNYYVFCWMGRAMDSGPNGVVWAMVQSCTVFPFLMGFLLFHVQPTLWRFVGFALLVAGIVCFGLDRQRTKPAGNAVCSGKWFLLALFGMTGCGLSQCAGSLPSYLAGDLGFWFGSIYRTLWAYVGMTGAFAVGAWFRRGGIRAALPRKRVAESVLFGFLLFVSGAAPGYIFFYNGLDFVTRAGAGAIGYPTVSGACILMFCLYSAVFLGERPERLQISGFLCTLFGLALISTG